MQQTVQPTSRKRVALAWFILIGNLILWISLSLWWLRSRPHRIEMPAEFTRTVMMFMIGMGFLVAGIAGYALLIFTNGLTFNLNQPIWDKLKPRFFLFNIVIPLMWSLGIGFILSAILGSTLIRFGLSAQMAYLLPTLVVVVLVQIAQLWVQIWTPLTGRVATRRLLAQGISAAQLQNAVLIGTSNPERSSFKKFGSVLDDIGALWIGPDQLVYWGDAERFAIDRAQLEHLERKADPGGISLLAAIAHVILHVRLEEGAVRQIRLHTVSLWTMGQHRRAMDQLAEKIAQWHNQPAPTTPRIT